MSAVHEPVLKVVRPPTEADQRARQEHFERLDKADSLIRDMLKKDGGQDIWYLKKSMNDYFTFQRLKDRFET